METKLIELRDRATFIPCIAIRLAPVTEANRFLLARAGYGITPDEQRQYVLFGRIAGGDDLRMECDPFSWHDRTFQIGHEYVIDNFDKIVTGDVVDVEFILGETDTPKESERTPASHIQTH